ncbi:MAG: hypothetical protein KAU06_02005 [Candidatus Marinimicrobia bacterium]|nr:hypothetical protein [Candidatus Neomarinimicrobiota bacterium]
MIFKVKTDKSVPGYCVGVIMCPPINRGVNPKRISKPSRHGANPPIYRWDLDDHLVFHTYFNGGFETDKSVPGLMDGNDMVPTLKRGVNPNRDSLNNACRNNPPIYWWDKNAPIPPKINRFNGLIMKTSNKQKGTIMIPIKRIITITTIFIGHNLLILQTARALNKKGV